MKHLLEKAWSPIIPLIIGLTTIIFGIYSCKEPTYKTVYKDGPYKIVAGVDELDISESSDTWINYADCFITKVWHKDLQFAEQFTPLIGETKEKIYDTVNSVGPYYVSSMSDIKHINDSMLIIWRGKEKIINRDTLDCYDVWKQIDTAMGTIRSHKAKLAREDSIALVRKVKIERIMNCVKL